ncbi:MAG: hypothetical protein F6K55_15390 [Moorea sp. SIO4A3]|nr:hypothetical protein [Moorena sp. SIO4A3]
MSRMFLTESVEFSEEAAQRLQAEGASQVLQAILHAISDLSQLSAD